MQNIENQQYLTFYSCVCVGFTSKLNILVIRSIGFHFFYCFYYFLFCFVFFLKMLMNYDDMCSWFNNMIYWNKIVLCKMNKPYYIAHNIILFIVILTLIKNRFVDENIISYFFIIFNLIAHCTLWANCYWLKKILKYLPILSLVLYLLRPESKTKNKLVLYKVHYKMFETTTRIDQL